MIFSYGSRRLRTKAFSFCRAAVLANSEISSIDCRLSFGSLVHWRMIFRRASRCFVLPSGIGTLLEVDNSGSAYQEALCHFSVFSFIVLTVMAKLIRSCSERTSSARSFKSQVTSKHLQLASRSNYDWPHDSARPYTDVRYEVHNSKGGPAGCGCGGKVSVGSHPRQRRLVGPLIRGATRPPCQSQQCGVS